MKFNGDVVCAILHILSSFLDYVSNLNERNEDFLIRLFIYSLGEYQQIWVKHCIRTRKINSFLGLIRVFLKYWGPHSQEYEGIFEHLIMTPDEYEEASHIHMKNQLQQSEYC
jgi:hypothetical protein